MDHVIGEVAAMGQATRQPTGSRWAGGRGRRRPRGQRQPPQGRPQGAVTCEETLAGDWAKHSSWKATARASGARAARQSDLGGAELSEATSASGQVDELLESLIGHVVECSKTADGCRLVQDALKLATKKGQKRLVSELRGHACELLESPHGNHVLQLAVDLLPPEVVDFIRAEIMRRWQPSTLAQQLYGCRVLERLIEHFPMDKLSTMLDDILGKADSLSHDQYGNFVIQHLLEHGGDHHRERIVDVVRNNVAHFVHCSFACGVLDKALTYGAWTDQLDIAQRILEQAPLLAMMAANAHGFASTQRIFKIAANAEGAACGAAAGQGLLDVACEQLLEQTTLHKISSSKHGQTLLNEVLPKEYHGASQTQSGFGRSRG